MAVQQTLDDLQLSRSVRGVAGNLSTEEAVPAAALINGILEIHPEYGGGLATKVRAQADGGERRPVRDWLIHAREAYEGSQVAILDGQMTVLALSMAEPSAATMLRESGFLEALAYDLEREVGTPLEELLLPEAFAAWQALIGEAGAGQASNVERNIAQVAQKGGPSPEQRAEPSERAEPPPPPTIHTALRALADSPTAVDRSLRFADYADALVEFIESPETSKPLTLGIDAAWGMGKTSLMYMIRERLDPGTNECDGPPRRQRQEKFTQFRTVWFNAWKYDQEEALWAALALEILAQTRRRSTLRQRVRTGFRLNLERFDGPLFLQDLLGALAKPLAFLLLGALLFIGANALLAVPGLEGVGWLAPLAAAVGVSGVYALGRTAYRYLTAPFELNITRYVRTPKYAEKIGFISEFEDDFRRVVRVVTDNGKWPLVVFIDDLDRCAPTKAVEIVEAINTVLDTEHCVFIIGMDGDAVAASIEVKYRALKEYLHEDPGGLTLGERFLEKIVQISFRIPRAEQTVVEAFIANILQPDGGPAEPPPTSSAREAEHLICAEQRAGRNLDEAASEVAEHAPKELSRADVEAARQRLRMRREAETEQVRIAVNEAARYLDFNPRKIKRYVNTFRLQALIARRRGMLAGPDAVRLLARAVIIASRWPNFVDAVLPDAAFVERLQEAHGVQRELARLRAAPEKEEAKERPLEARLAVCLAHPALKRLMGASELIALLEEMDTSERRKLTDYLALARTTGPTHYAA